MRLGALASVDHWNQVRVDPYEGPAQRGATADNTITWASGTDARRARAFVERATFVVCGSGAGGCLGVPHPTFWRGQHSFTEVSTHMTPLTA